MGKVEDTLFCAAPWNHFFIPQSGKVRVCCMYENVDENLGDINKQTWREIWEGEKYQELRRKFLEKDPEVLKYCKHCTDYDKFGGGSCRHQYTSIVEESRVSLDYLVKFPRIKSLDLRTSKVCGLSCLICGPWNSTRWCKELDFPEDEITEEGRQNLQELVESAKKTIVHANIVGGEPFMMEEAIDLIEKLQPYKRKVNLMINTNCQTLTYKGKEILPLLEGFKYVQIDASLDAIGKAAEYQRYGGKWEVISANFEKLLNTPFHVWVHPTVSIFNILHLPYLLQYLESKQMFNIHAGNILVDPKEYDIRNLPEDLKNLVESIVLDRSKGLCSKNKELVDGWLRAMREHESSTSFSSTVQKVTEVDRRRNNNFLDINPEFEPWWKLD